MADTNLQVKIGLDDNISSGLKKIESNFSNLNSSIGKSVGSMIATVGKIGAVVGAAAIATAGIALKSSSDIQNMQVALKTAFQGSKEEADRAYKTISTFAAKTPYQMGEVMTSFIKLKNLGLDPSNRALEAYGNTASSMGKDLNMMIEAVADASTGEFERLKEFGIRAKKEGDNVAFTFQGVTTNVKNNSKDIENYLIKLGETKFAGGMEAQSQTLSGKLSTLKDNVGMAFNEFAVKSGFLDFATKAVGRMSEMLEKADIGKQIDIIKASWDYLFKGDSYDRLVELTGMPEDEGLVAFLTNLSNGFIIVKDAVVAAMTPVMNWIKTIAEVLTPYLVALGVLLVYLGAQVLAALKYAWEQLKQPVLDFLQAIKDFWIAAQPIIIALATIFTLLVVPVLQASFAIIVQLFKGALQVITGALNMISGIFNVVIGTIKGLITGDFSQAIEGFKQYVRGLGQWLSGLWSIIGAPFKGAFDGVQNMLKGIDFFAIAVAWMEQLVNGVKSKAGSIGSSIKSALGNTLPDIVKRAVGLASGTNFAAGGSYLVGETGPEMVTLPQGSRVTRSSETRNMLQSTKQGVTQNNYITMNNSVDWEIGTSILARKLRLS